MSNLIQVSDTYAIASDSRQWMVQKTQNHTDPDTKEISSVWVSKTYHGSLEQAVHSLGQLLLRKANATSYGELEEAAKNISTLLNQKFCNSVVINVGIK